MSFEFSDLNAQLMPGNLQAQLCPALTGQACFCFTTHLTCRCLSNFVTCRCLSNYATCFCLSRPVTCICLSKPIITGRPPTIRDFTIYEHITEVTRELSHPSELDLLRAELDDAIKHVDVHREVLERTAGPQSDEALDEAEAQLKQQLELLQKQRAEYRKQRGGGGGGGKAGAKK